MATTEERIAKLETLIAPFVERQEDIARTEQKILRIVRQMARLRCGGYYVGDDGVRYLTRNPDELRIFQSALDLEISKLGVDLMGTDTP